VSRSLGIAISSFVVGRAGDRLRSGLEPGDELVAVESDAPLPPVATNAEVFVHGYLEGPLASAEGILATFPGVRWIHSLSAGIDALDVAGIGDREVIVTNSAGVYAPGMAEYVLAGMVWTSRGLGRWADPAATRGDGPLAGLGSYAPAGHELRGRRVGIIGYGAVGRQLAVLCRAVGMEVWATRRTPMVVETEPIDRALDGTQLPELLAACDVLVLCASLNTTTRHLLDRDAFGLVRRGAVLINVARGGLVDQDALLEALGDGRVGGAFLDVTTPEPLPPDHPLRSAPNVYITPHLSGDTEESWGRMIDAFLANLRRYRDGRTSFLANLVDPAHHR
jgi:phosphoglycerate dehydrogenase-like enzyme